MNNMRRDGVHLLPVSKSQHFCLTNYKELRFDKKMSKQKLKKAGYGFYITTHDQPPNSLLSPLLQVKQNNVTYFPLWKYNGIFAVIFNQMF